MNFDLKKLLDIFCKKYLILIMVLILIFTCVTKVQAETTYNVTTNPEVKKYIIAADKASTTPEKIKNHMLAANAVDKTPLTKDNAILLAVINYSIGKEALNIANLNIAIKAFQKSYGYLKVKNIHKNNELAFQNLYILSSLAGMYNDENTGFEYLNELVKTQYKFEKNIHLNLKLFTALFQLFTQKIII